MNHHSGHSHQWARSKALCNESLPVDFMALDWDQCLWISFKKQFFQIRQDLSGIFPRATWHFQEFIFIQLTFRSQFSVIFTWKKLVGGGEGKRSTVRVYLGFLDPSLKVSLRSGGTGSTLSHPFLSVSPKEQPQPTEAVVVRSGYGRKLVALPSLGISFTCPAWGRWQFACHRVSPTWGEPSILLSLSVYRLCRECPALGLVWHWFGMAILNYHHSSLGTLLLQSCKSSTLPAGFWCPSSAK